MRGRRTCVTILLITFAVVLSDAQKRGFMLTIPKVLKGSTFSLPLNLYNVDADGEVKIQVTADNSKTVLGEGQKLIEKGQSTHIELKISKTSEYWATVQVNGSFSTTPPYEFSKSKSVYIQQSRANNITFIETDKPIYKPGQKVRFRILPIDGVYLKPRTDVLSATVWLEDPNGVRVDQWLNVSFESAIVQLESQLSEDPVQGSWRIYVKIGDSEESQYFKVEEYVLPKFSVSIKNPPFLLADAQNITWTVCAKYTYGKPVHGNVSIKVSYPVYSWEQHLDKPSITHNASIKGCYEFTANTSGIEFNKDSYSYRGVEFFAEVTEKGTDVKRNASSVIHRTNNPLSLTFTSGEYFKPGLPFYGQLKVTKPDGTPAPEEEIELCAVGQKEMWTDRRWASLAESDCKVYFSEEDGVIDYVLPPKSQDTISYKLEARALKYEENRSPRIYQPKSNKRLQAWYSPSGSHLQIEPLRSDAVCEDKIKVTLLLTTPENAQYKMQYQLYSRGKLVKEGDFDYTFQLEDAVLINATNDTVLTEEEVLTKTYLSGQRVTLPPYVAKTSFEIDTTHEMSPVSRLMVYYVREDGETVADSQKINFEKCLPNKVSMKFGNERQQPATPASIHVTAHPGSICGIGAVDQSVYLQQQGQDIEQRIYNDLSGQDVSRYSGPSQGTSDYCNQYISKPAPLPKPMALVLHPEKRSIRRPYLRPVPPRFGLVTAFVDALTAFDELGVQVLTDLVVETRPCWRRFNTDSYYPSYADSGFHPGPVAAPHRNKIGVVALAGAPPPRPAPSAIPEAANFAPGAGGFTAIKSAVEVRDYFPETWLWDIETVGDDGSLDYKKELPHSITKWVGKAVCVSKDVGFGVSKTATITGFQEFFVEYTLPYSVIRGELVWLPISVFNYLEECLPVTLKLDPSEEFELVNGTSDVSLCVCGGSSETHKYLVRPKTLGQMNITVRSFSSQDAGICGDKPVAAKAVARDAATKPLLVEPEGFPEEKTESRFFCGNFETEFDLLLPDDVVEGSSRAYVSASGDLMGPTLKGLDKLVRLPTGCGEQNMMLFVPNIVVLDYLTATGKLTEEIDTKARNNLKSGYQRQLKYKRSDNSYSAFGNNDEEGSMWLTLFVIRSFKAATKYIQLDEKNIDTSIEWVTKKVLANGCVPRVGRVLHGGLKGGLSGPSDSHGPLTAYAVASLLESEYNGTAVIDDAIQCMEKQPPSTAYALALYAYAAALAKRPSAEMYLNLLKEKQIAEGDLIYWQDKGELNSRSIQVETAAYVVRTLMLLKGKDGVSESLPIVRWISRQRNSNGGFVSTQDTIVALLALSEYAKHISQDKLEMTIKAQGNDFNKEYTLNEDNKILVQTDKLTSLPTSLDVKTAGSGCAFVQATSKYNVMTPPETQTFNLSVVAENPSPSDEKCMTLKLKSCFNTLNMKKPTNMAVLEIKMLSGYAPDREVLGQQIASASIKVKRYEVETNQINLYFDEVTDDVSCVEFDIVKEAEVDNLQPATAKIYDYYKQEHLTRTSYTIDDMCQSSSKTSSTNQPTVIIAGSR